jgi:shikimate dehydrogenase
MTKASADERVTRLYAVLGWPVAHSRSPAMHNAAFAALGLDAVYVPLAVPPDKLPAAVEAIRTLGLAGVNVTLPHKSTIMPLLDELEPVAVAIGAVNTVVLQGEKLLGTNTDAQGLVRSLEQAAVGVQGARVVIVGAGGAARASVVGLAQAGAQQILVAARRKPLAEALVSELSAHAGSCKLLASDLGAELERACGQATLLLQATSATLAQNPDAPSFAAALPLQALPKAAVVCDLVYQPLRTSVLERARALGLTTVDGLGMLLHQGALALQRWTGRQPPLGPMREALLRTGP